MPSIVNARSVHLIDEVVKIQDSFPAKVRKEKKMYTEEDIGDQHRVIIMDVFDMAEFASSPTLSATGDEMDVFTTEEEEVVSSTAAVAAELLHKAAEEAEHLKADALQAVQFERDELLAAAAAEAAVLRQEAAQQGHQEGYEAGTAFVQGTLDKLENTVSNLEGELAGFQLEYEEQAKWMAMEIASRVLHQKVDTNDSILTAMVEQTLQGMRNEPWIRVEVAQEMTHLIGSLQDLYNGREQVDISPIPAEPGTILVETASGVVDASINTQLDNLKRYFQKSSP